jgi:hypothetical protein
VSRRVKLRSAETITGGNAVAYKRAVAMGRGRRERSIGLSGKDAASAWLRMSPAERRALKEWLRMSPVERRALSDSDVRAQAATKAQKGGMPLG